MLVPYHQGLSEKVKKTCSKYGVQVHFHGGQAIKSLLMAPKKNDPINSKSGVIYRYQCTEQGCGEGYIGESGRTFAERLKSIKSPLHQYLITVTPQVIISTSTNLCYWEGETRMSQEQFKRQYL